MMPTSNSRLAAITDYSSWRAALEEYLSNLETRVATRQDSGTAVLWLGPGPLPAGHLAANGAVVDRATYPSLFAAIGTTYNTGGETGAQFRLPNIGGAPAGVWAIRT